MFESIKTKLWDLLKEKEVSLAMLYNREGEILWHKGRDIIGRTIDEGEGFSKSYMKRTLKNKKTIEKENVLINSKIDGLPESALHLNVKSLMILPVGEQFFLYVDSGARDSFNQSDRVAFKILGELLGNIIEMIRKNEMGITGSSKEIRKVKEKVLKYSMEDEPILLLGETGVGKSRIAELINRYSGRTGTFVTVNTPSIPENLFESELFGHKAGAFTDAKSDKKGLVDEADGGTLFFDEISEVPVPLQAKLLRFINTKKYSVLGESTEREANVRMVAATNKNLGSAIEKKEFREDLYFRLQILEIDIPPLRERMEDIKPLVMERINLLKGKEIGKDFWDALFKHDWPGNVRELFTVMTRAGILLESPITGRDIEEIIHQSSVKKIEDSLDRRINGIWADLRSGKSFWEVVKKPFLKRDLNRMQVKAIIKKALNNSSGKYKDILSDLNIDLEDHKKFLNFINDYDLKP